MIIFLYIILRFLGNIVRLKSCRVHLNAVKNFFFLLLQSSYKTKLNLRSIAEKATIVHSLLDF